MNKKLDIALEKARDLADRLRDAGLASAKVAVRTRLWDEAPKFARGELLKMALREGVNVGNMHAVHAYANPERLALVDERHAWNFAETNDKINQICQAFTRIAPRGARPRVVLCMENRVDYALVWFALFRLGWPAVHASNVATTEELRFLFERSEPLIAVGSETTRTRLEDAAPSGCTIFSADAPPRGARAVSLHEHIAGYSRRHFQRDRSASGQNIVFTSGTTGKPKGAIRDFATMGVIELVEVLERMPISLQERHLVVSQLYHSAGQAFTLIMAALGATIFIEAEFEPESLLRSIHENKITSLFMVPTMISRVLHLEDTLFAKYPPNDLNAIISGAGLFTHELREQAIARFGADTIYDFYGASELGWVTLIGGTEMLERPRSQGRPLRGQEMRIVDGENGENVLPPHTIGLIQVRTQTRMEGYLGDEESSNEIVSEDGWMTVDDTGYLDEDGYLYIAGRARDMIISGGVNIYPAEIEEVLIQHPEIIEVSVVGAPDAEWGEKLVGFVHASAELTIEALEAWSRERITGYKVPRVWYRIDELPRNPTGKVLKKDLEVVARGDGKVDDDASDVAKRAAANVRKFGDGKRASSKPNTSKSAAPASKTSDEKPAAPKKADEKKTAAKAVKKAPATKKTVAKKKVAEEKPTAKKAAAKKAAAKKEPAKKKVAEKKANTKPAAKKAAAKNTERKKTASKPAAKKAAKPRTPKKARSPKADTGSKKS